MTDSQYAAKLFEQLDALDHRYRRFTRGALVAFAILIAAVVVLSVNRERDAAKLARVAVTTNDSLCALRRDLEGRVEGAERFLATHPKGFAGIPAGAIRVNVANQQRTILALSPLVCDGVPPGP